MKKIIKCFQKIYLPGDNDIGGEEDMVSARIHNRFNFAYSQPDTLIHKSVTFFKVILQDFLEQSRAWAFLDLSNDGQKNDLFSGEQTDANDAKRAERRFSERLHGEKHD